MCPYLDLELSFLAKVFEFYLVTPFVYCSKFLFQLNWNSRPCSLNGQLPILDQSAVGMVG